MNLLSVQKRLKELGFNPGPLHGLKGPRTDAAIRAFKRSVGLRDRAFLGPITLEALFSVGRLAHDDDHSLPWMRAALAVKGLHEARDRAALVKWFSSSVAWLDPREVAWCGAFVETCHRIADPAVVTPENPLGARNWGKFGKACPPVFGATLVFWRGSKSGWQGHVGFYFAEDATAYHVLGGNQSDAVTVTRVSKDRLLGARWPEGVPVTGKRILVKSNGYSLSTNEA